jgi:hypothetical protein
VGAGATSVPGVLRPVGPLPAAVYWRRRITVLVVLLALLGGGGWLGWTLWTGRADASAGDPTTQSARTTEIPALERVVPSASGIRTPTPPSGSVVVETPVPPAPVPGSPCTDEMIGVTVRAPASAPVGSKPTFELLVENVSPVPCQRALDKELQELVLLDSAGTRLWGSNDCFPEASDDVRTLAPGEVVAFPVVWGGLSSEPTCTAPRVPPVPGSYLLRARLDTKTSADAAIALT